MKFKLKKNTKKYGIIIFIILAIALSYYIGSTFSIPSYIKSGVTTFVFTSPGNDVETCKEIAPIFISNLFPICTSQSANCISCSFTDSKYFPGEIDCVCLIK